MNHEEVVQALVSRGQIENYLDRVPDHYKPILMAVRDMGCSLAVILQGRTVFDLPEDGRTFIAHVGDDLHEALGPSGFDRLSLKRMVRRARAAVVVSSSATVFPYATAAGFAGLGLNTLLIETRPKFEQAWVDFLERYRPGITRLISTVRPEGAVQ